MRNWLRISKSSPAIEREIPITVDGQEVLAIEGETVLSALTAMGVRVISENDHGERSGAYCAMGICYCCTVEIDSQGKQRACCVLVSPAMKIRTCQNRNHDRDGMKVL